tara:strand:+ start:419 stop:943 length:525 start_codon:yes stop_codon:yes gene_type:complete
MKEKPTRGLLDYIDITIGRVSDSDSSNPGKRKRSWGATVMFFCMIPSFTLVLAVAFNVFISSLSLQKAAKKAPTTKIAVKTKRRAPKVTVATFPKPVSIEWPIVVLASLIMLIGVSFSLFRRKQDLDRAIQLGKMVAEVKHGVEDTVKNLPSSVSTMYQTAKSKIGSEEGGDDH